MKLIELVPNKKFPPKGSWKESISDDPADHQRWLAEGANIGMPLEENGRVVVDFDTGLEAARAWCRANREICTFIVQTRRGIHFHFKGESTTRKFEHGDIKANGYVVYPPSTVDGCTYRFIQTGELQPFPEHLFPPKPKEVANKEILVVRAYVAKIESKQGQNGSAGLVRAAARCRDAGLSEAETMVVLMEWNLGPTVDPPWAPNELARAVTRVFKLHKEN